MPFRFNGFGTAYYGKRDLANDGSYVTTVWVTALWIPLVPLGSYRVLPVGNQQYLTTPVPLCVKQVGNVYFVVVAVLVGIFFIFRADLDTWWKEKMQKKVPPQVVLQPAPPNMLSII